ncbi:MAG: hypothetical protein A3K19_27590 [Lentisphaerae bacterium RIFOXYB12_FULL_65_16]|nr:MAG: hypothetical protein A3K18_24960 [Lentisphaerae bacterium RIFOXYA12_64_32]OGV86067.1 MAG: hypothetical protein A3K19_27590 [Lentisphaerae bacterium RIFOXYB12_FULL_65_16]
MHKTLIIGIAGRGASWAKAVKANAAYELTGIADISADALAARGEEFGVAPEQRHTDYRAALASGGYDAALVVVPHRFHYEVSRSVLEAGLHCLVEKPFTLNVAEAEELVALAAQRQRVLQVVQNYRFMPACRFVEQFIREQRLGRLSSVEGSFYRDRPPRDHEVNMPWPQLFTQGIHHLDWLVAILPAPIVEVVSRHRKVPWSRWQNSPLSHVLMRCDDGVLVTYCASYVNHGDNSPYSGLWRFEFEKGDLILDRNDVVRQATENGAKVEEVFRPPAGAKSGDDWLLDTLHTAITDGVEPPTSGRNNLKTLRLLFDVIGEAK